jgi:two-component system chemotaxis response regulator CheY
LAAAISPWQTEFLNNQYTFEVDDGGQRPFCGNEESGMNTSLPVLVVDDSRTMTTIISKLVRDVGFTTIDQVNDGPSALERMREKKYGLVLSDWDMRPMNGTELISQIRKDPANSDTLVIMITAKCDADVSWLSGADGYLMKPFNANALREIIEEVLSQRADDIPLVG